MQIVNCYGCGSIVKVDTAPVLMASGPVSDDGRQAIHEFHSQACADHYKATAGVVEAIAIEAVKERSELNLVGSDMTPEKEEYRRNLDLIWNGEVKGDPLFAPPEMFWGATFKSAKNTSAVGFGEAAKQFLNRDRHLLALIGLKGRGKTWAAYAIMNGFLAHSFGKSWHSARFITWSKLKILASKCSSNYGPTAEQAEREMAALIKVGLLVIDEFGLTKPLDNQLDHIHNLLDERFVNKRWTIVTTTRSLSELEEIMGGGIVDRFSGGRTGGRVVEFSGPSQRQESL